MLHRKRTFEEELIGLLEKHGIPYMTSGTFGTELKCRTFGAQVQLVRFYHALTGRGYWLSALRAYRCRSFGPCFSKTNQERTS
jgi:hypothetical protein